MIKNILILFFGIIFARNLEVEFISDNPWLAGHPWASGIAFDNGVTYGLGVYGNSSISTNNVGDVELYLSENPDSTSISMVFSHHRICRRATASTG